jgi:alkylation response protein AidB-like acyl-CoA dehydrogenase
MGHYTANVRDLEFNLFEVLGRQQVLGSGPYADVDEDTARAMLHEMARLAENELAASFVASDREPPVFDPATHEVRLPEAFKRSYRAYVDAEWWRMDVPAEVGGTLVPPSLRWALAEMVLGANPAVHMYSSGFGFSKVMYLLGTPDQRALRAAHHRAAVGLDHGADRAGRRVGRRRRPHQGGAAARRHLAHHRGQAVHHQR